MLHDRRRILFVLITFNTAACRVRRKGSCHLVEQPGVIGNPVENRLAVQIGGAPAAVLVAEAGLQLIGRRPVVGTPQGDATLREGDAVCLAQIPVVGAATIGLTDAHAGVMGDVLGRSRQLMAEGDLTETHVLGEIGLALELMQLPGGQLVVEGVLSVLEGAGLSACRAGQESHKQ